MIQRLYIHNYRCLENFELKTKEMQSCLLISKNGAGKSTVGAVLEILQKIGNGINRIKDLLMPNDFVFGQQEQPIRIEIEVMLNSKRYRYDLAFELPENFRELRIREESLNVDGTSVYTRNLGEVTFSRTPGTNEATFMVDWHLVALPVIQEQSDIDPLHVFKSWLTRMIILHPVPVLMTGESKGETLSPDKHGKDFAEWFSGLLARYPAAYTRIHHYLFDIMPDFKDFLNEPIGRESKSMTVRFQDGKANMRIPFEDLSDGEKCFFSQRHCHCCE